MFRRLIALSGILFCLFFTACAGGTIKQEAPPVERIAGAPKHDANMATPTISATPEPTPTPTPAPTPAMTAAPQATPEAAAGGPPQEEPRKEIVEEPAMERAADGPLWDEYYIEPEEFPDEIVEDGDAFFGFFVEDSPAIEGAYEITLVSVPRPFEANEALMRSISAISLAESEQQCLQRAASALGYPYADISAFHITYDTDEVISCLIAVDRMLIPITINRRTGGTIRLGEFFTGEDRAWRGLLPDIVAASAASSGIMLLCEVPLVDENHLYFLMDGNIVLLYRPYEITTYEAGSPCFTLPMQELRQYTTGAYGIGGG